MTPNFENLISKGKIEQVIAILLKHFKDNKNKEVYNDILLQSARFQSNENEKRKNLIDNAEYKITKNQIIDAIQYYINNEYEVLPSLNKHDNMNNSNELNIFISYSSADRNLRKILQARLEIYLRSTKNSYNPIWSDIEIQIGSDWNNEIQNALSNSNIGILLISPMFLGSRYAMGEELDNMLKRRQNGYLLIPILLRECNFHFNKDLASIQFYKTYKSEYDVTDLLEKNKLMPFDELVEITNPNERLLNKYFQKLANNIDNAVEKMREK